MYAKFEILLCFFVFSLSLINCILYYILYIYYKIQKICLYFWHICYCYSFCSECRLRKLKNNYCSIWRIFFFFIRLAFCLFIVCLILNIVTSQADFQFASFSYFLLRLFLFLAAKCSTKNHSGRCLSACLSVCLGPLPFLCHLLKNFQATHT